MAHMTTVQLLSLFVLVALSAPFIMAAVSSQTYVVDSVVNCGQPGNPTTEQVYLAKFAVNVTLSPGVWAVRALQGAFTYQNGMPWWAFSARLTPTTCFIVPGASSGGYACLSGLATNVLGSPQVWNSSTEAFQAASGSELLIPVPAPATYYLWIQDNYCPDNYGALKLLFVQYQ